MVHGLPYKFSWQDLKDLCRCADMGRQLNMRMRPTCLRAAGDASGGAGGSMHAAHSFRVVAPPPPCRPAGAVVRADIVLDHDGRSKGFGLVAFTTPSDAQAAIEVRVRGSLAPLQQPPLAGPLCAAAACVALWAGAATPAATGSCQQLPLPSPQTLQMINSGTELEGRMVSAKLDKYS